MADIRHMKVILGMTLYAYPNSIWNSKTDPREVKRTKIWPVWGYSVHLFINGSVTLPYWLPGSI